MGVHLLCEQIADREGQLTQDRAHIVPGHGLQGGAGLGLSLCNEIVQLHGGTMQFESRVGNGTVVTVELKGGRV